MSELAIITCVRRIWNYICIICTSMLTLSHHHNIFYHTQHKLMHESNSYLRSTKSDITFFKLKNNEYTSSHRNTDHFINWRKTRVWNTKYKIKNKKWGGIKSLVWVYITLKTWNITFNTVVLIYLIIRSKALNILEEKLIFVW